MRFRGFVGPSYTLPSVNFDCQRTINLYPEFDELGTGKEGEVAALVGTPGLQLLVTLGTGPVRGLYRSSNNRLFAVSYNKLYELDSDWNATERGTLNSTEGQVSMADNGIHLVTVDGGDGYSLKFSDNTFAEMTFPTDFGGVAYAGSDQVNFQDGYFIFNNKGTGQVFISDLNSIDISALDYGTAEGNPDPIVGIISNHRELWLFNSQSAEVFYDSGGANFPFSRIEGAFVEQGCAATFSIAEVDNTVFWLGQDDKGAGIVYMASGYQPKRISTTPVEFAISTYDTISDAIAFTYQERGHTFYVLNFPSADATWAYDTGTGMWHERAYFSNGEFHMHRATCHAFAFNTHVVGDYETGKVYALSSQYFTDNGDAIVRLRRTPHVSAGRKRVFYTNLELDIESGVGIDGSGQGSDPQAMLRFSNDGGHTWLSEKWVSIGKIGQTKLRARWERLGSARDRVFEVRISDPVRVAIVGAELNFEVGNS